MLGDIEVDVYSSWNSACSGCFKKQVRVLDLASEEGQELLRMRQITQVERLAKCVLLGKLALYLSLA